jgi:hypothetical protein
MTVSFFTRDDKEGASSTIKFGSMDQIALEKRKDIDVVRTSNNKSWDLAADQMKIGTEELIGAYDDGWKNLVRFEPQLPWIYLPQDLYEKFADYVNRKYRVIGQEIICRDGNVCKFD